MVSSHPLITTIVASVVTAFIFGYIAKRLKFPPIIGYLVAGIVIGPYTPGIVADQDLATQLAEIGVILLMFGVGLHFSLSDLLSIRRVALPGAIFQMTVATFIGGLYMFFRDEGIVQSLVFGFSLSVASTVVLLRMLEQRRQLNTKAGRIAVGWLVVEDIAMVLAIVLLPVLATTIINENHVFDLNETLIKLITTLAKIGIFAILMIVFGRRFLPAILTKITKFKMQEMVTLGMLAVALGFAYLAYKVFDASFALGAFLAGMVLNESELGHSVTEQTRPLRDIFAVLFFVSVGMLFNPAILWKDPVSVLIVISVIIVGKSMAALFITTLFKQSLSIGSTIAISLAQIGEFSFIFAGMALSMGLMAQTSFDLILAGALISIALNPFLFQVSDRLLEKKKSRSVGI